MLNANDARDRTDETIEEFLRMRIDGFIKSELGKKLADGIEDAINRGWFGATIEVDNLSTQDEHSACIALKYLGYEVHVDTSLDDTYKTRGKFFISWERK